MDTHLTERQRRHLFFTWSAQQRSHGLEIVDVLAQGPRSVEMIATEIDQSVANTSQHLRVLATSGLVVTQRRGNHVIYALARPEVGQLLESIRDIAAEQLDAIERLVADHLGPRDEIDWITKRELLRRLRLDPRLPKPLHRLRLFVRYRGQSLDLELAPDAVRVKAMHCQAPSIRIAVNGKMYEIAPSERRRIRLT